MATRRPDRMRRLLYVVRLYKSPIRIQSDNVPRLCGRAGSSLYVTYMDRARTIQQGQYNHPSSNLASQHAGMSPCWWPFKFLHEKFLGTDRFDDTIFKIFLVPCDYISDSWNSPCAFMLHCIFIIPKFTCYSCQ